MNDFVKELSIDWDPETLLKVMLSQPYKSWKEEEYITNKYLRISDSYIDNIREQLALAGYVPRNHFFSEMLPNTQLPIHTDISRVGAVNFPLLGDWNNSMLEFYDQDKQTLIYAYKYKVNQAVWVNTEKYHTVKNNGIQRRFIFSVSLY